jgi:hypothetical protein
VRLWKRGRQHRQQICRTDEEYAFVFEIGEGFPSGSVFNDVTGGVAQFETVNIENFGSVSEKRTKVLLLQKQASLRSR